MPARLALLLLLVLAAGYGRAQTPIRHCLGADGHPVFTDQTCASQRATPAPATAATAASVAPSLRPPAVTCAGDVDQLRQAVLDAFSSGDANRLAGLMLWSGYGEHGAVADIRSLAALMHRPLLDIEAPAASGSADPPTTDDAPAALIVQTAGEDGSGSIQQTRFALERRSGCLWLRQEP